MWYNGFPYPPPQQPMVQAPPSLEDIKRTLDFWQAWNKEMEDKRQAEVNKQKTINKWKGRKFGVVEVFLLLVICALPVGMFTSYIMVTLTKSYVEAMQSLLK